MDTLRLILVLVGAAVIGAVYLHWTTTRGRRRDELDAHDGDGESFEPLPDDFDGPRVRRRAGFEPSLEGDHAGRPESASEPASPGEALPPFSASAMPAAPEPEDRLEPATAASRARDHDPDAVIDVDDLDAIAAAHPDAADLQPPAELPTDVLGIGARAASSSEPVPAAGIAEEPALGSLDGLPVSAAGGPRQLDLAGIDATSGARTEPRVEPDSASEPDMVIVLTVMARQGQQLAGPAVRAALELVGLVHGDMSIYHRHAVGQGSGTAPVFSVANVRNPGAFDPATMDAMTTPGLAFFMRVPGPVDSASAFQQMLEAGRRVAERLDAVLCDETRSTLTTQSINHFRERIAEHARKRLITGRR